MDNNTIKYIAFTAGTVILAGLAVFGIVRIVNTAANKQTEDKKKEPEKLANGKK